MDERAFKTKLIGLLRGRGVFCLSTADRFRVGIPDVYACQYGLSFWLELKYTDTPGRLGHELTTQQSIFLRDINEHGGVGMVVVGFADSRIHWERITEPGAVSNFDWDPRSETEFLECISNLAKAFVTPSLSSDTSTLSDIEKLLIDSP